MVASVLTTGLMMGPTTAGSSEGTVLPDSLPLKSVQHIHLGLGQSAAVGCSKANVALLSNSSSEFFSSTVRLDDGIGVQVPLSITSRFQVVMWCGGEPTALVWDLMLSPDQQHELVFATDDRGYDAIQGQNFPVSALNLES
jgi:hypothetical protein